MLFICPRGRENLHGLNNTDFVIREGKTGNYVEEITDEITKNHRENDSSWKVEFL